MRRHIGSIAAASAMLSLGLMGGFSGGRREGRRREPSIDDVEYLWVQKQMRILRQKQRMAAKAIAELAKATGPWAHRFSYGPPPQTREIARRLRQQAAREAKRK